MQRSCFTLETHSATYPQIQVGYDVGKFPWVTMLENSTRGYERYMALDIHREYVLVGAWNEEKDWVLMPRRVSTRSTGEPLREA